MSRSPLPTEREFILLGNDFAGSGVRTIVCQPDQVEYGAGRLLRGDFRIDLVYKWRHCPILQS
jgi:hypothetical protein